MRNFRRLLFIVFLAQIVLLAVHSAPMNPGHKGAEVPAPPSQAPQVANSQSSEETGTFLKDLIDAGFLKPMTVESDNPKHFTMKDITVFDVGITPTPRYGEEVKGPYGPDKDYTAFHILDEKNKQTDLIAKFPTDRSIIRYPTARTDVKFLSMKHHLILSGRAQYPGTNEEEDIRPIIITKMTDGTTCRDALEGAGKPFHKSDCKDAFCKRAARDALDSKVICLGPYEPHALFTVEQGSLNAIIVSCWPYALFEVHDPDHRISEKAFHEICRHKVTNSLIGIVSATSPSESV
ncbi:hypothetical protein F5878DRAFT_613163 [Lentinula raphanica]|uniref:Uncharacterized protein n=1 Tax=Lentinula raphanica TaxID=153919 RepID=A0AA38UGN5_9AGAR|nr:hypothetical protein F5878DRAFT_613163 [Lentinula raphanica]